MGVFIHHLGKRPNKVGARYHTSGRVTIVNWTCGNTGPNPTRVEPFERIICIIPLFPESIFSARNYSNFLNYYFLNYFILNKFNIIYLLSQHTIKLI